MSVDGMVMFYTLVDEQQPDVCVVVFQLVQNVMESTFCWSAVAIGKLMQIKVISEAVDLHHNQPLEADHYDGCIATGWQSLWQVILIFLSTGTRAQICSWILQLLGLHNSLLLSQVQHQDRMLYVDTPSWRMLILTFQTEINRIIMGCGSSCRCDMFSLSKQAWKTLFIQKWCIVVTYL